MKKYKRKKNKAFKEKKKIEKDPLFFFKILKLCKHIKNI